MTEDALADAVLAALRPTGLRDRVRLRLGGGFTPLQVWDRLPSAMQAALAEGEGISRRGVTRVQQALVRLANEGRVSRSRVEMTVPLGSKGPRDVVVDVFRAR